MSFFESLAIDEVAFEIEVVGEVLSVRCELVSPRCIWVFETKF